MSTQYDLIVYGASSFVGAILCRYLVEQYGSGDDLSWAIAGRNATKLESLRTTLGAPDLPVIVAEAGDQAQVEAMVGQAKVIVSTVGPYALYGSILLGECAKQGKSYCDLTGEAQWIARMIHAHQQQAEASGARIVNSCGFDSIPSDLGVLFTQQQFQRQHGHYASKIRMRVKAMKGGASGGTIASMMNMFAEISEDPALRKILGNPFSLAPAGQQRGPKQPEVTLPRREADTEQWLAPFVMAAINTKIVHRSHALLQKPWGDDFQYDEAMWMGTGPAGSLRAAGLAAGLAGMLGVAVVGPLRKLLEKALPAPGEGPTPEQQISGYFDLRFFAEDKEGNQLMTKVTGQGDPGYGATAKMLGEAAVCLARDDTELVATGGLWTPATAFAEPMLKQAMANAGLTFELL